MAYPSTFSSFNRPTASDRLNSPSHSALHNSVSSALGQVEAVLGLADSSSTLGTIIGDLRSPSSGGGGHVQTAAKGGTGQTSFTKGDILVASNSSTLSKLAVGSNGEFLSANSGTATGLGWASTLSTKVAVNTSTAGYADSSLLTVIFATSVLGSTLGTNSAVRLTGYIQPFATGNNTIDITVSYGANTVASVRTVTGATSVLAAGGKLEVIVAGAGSATAQKGVVSLSLFGNRTEAQGDTNLGISKFTCLGTGNSSINSAATQNLIVRSQFVDTLAQSSLVTQMMLVEKIV